MSGKYIKLRSILTALILLVVAAMLLNQTTTNPVSASGGTVSVIVELKDDPAAVYKARAAKSGQNVSDEALKNYRASLTAKQDEFLTGLAANGVTASIVSRNVKNYDGSLAATVPLRYTLVYNGVAMNVPYSAIGTIEAMPQVKKVHPNAMLETSLNSSVKYINAPKVYGAVQELTQFDDLREGYEGQGINIAIVDTGIDWAHPMFGGDPTPPRLAVAPPTPAVTSTNKKVIYYLPLTDTAAYDGFGHGTHVASTAAGYLALHPGGDGIPGTADDIRLHGVAPQAKLMSYKVCSDIRSIPGSLGLPSVGGCESADTIMALEDAVSPFTLTGQTKPIAHVINLSLGGSGGPNDPTAVACSNAALTGATVVAASGNSGPGEGTTGSPAAGTHVISVGATTHPSAGASQWSADLLQGSSFPQTRTGAVTPANSFGSAAGTNRLTLFPMSGTASLPAGSMAQRYVFVNLPLGQWPASVNGRIALIKDALGATIFDIVAQAYNAGAVGVILFDDRGAVNGVKTLIPAATISPADGEVLVDALSSTDNNAVDPANGALSELPIRMNPFLTNTFMGQMGDFSSRGPVQGLGQIKPDVSAPGVAVLAAAPPGSVVGALGLLEGTPDYAHLDGTSMATPHTTGAAALIKQAHLDWSPDVIRTVLINTSTNMRSESGAPKADGLTADSIIAQGGGLIDVKEAVNAKALMGVEGDGIEKPSILGSHSFGEVPVANSRVTHTSPVSVTVRDLSGQGGTYNLAVANNRDLQIAGISVTTSQPSVTLEPNGSATFTVSATFDGDRLRDVMAAKTAGTDVPLEKIQMQWYVTAKRSDNAESLRMPFYFKAGPTMPAQPIVQTIEQTATVPAPAAGQQVAEGATHVEVPFEVDASTFKVEALVEWFGTPQGSQEDVDYELLDPDGNVIASSGGPAGASEHVSVTVNRAGTYKHRIIGFVNAATECTVTTTLTKGNTPPVVQAIAGDFTNAQGKPVDFDGTVNLSWQATDGATGYEVERSADGTNYAVVASAGAGQTSASLADQPNGENFYRVRAFAPGQIGSYVTAPSNVASVIVDRRTKVNITDQVTGEISNVSFTGGIFKLDFKVKGENLQHVIMPSTYYPGMEVNVVGITTSPGGSNNPITVKNAENGKDGKSLLTGALFTYSQLLGTDEKFTPAEVTGGRTLEFNDPTAQMFSFDVMVTAYERAPGGGEGAAAGGGSAAGAGAGGNSTQSGTSLQSLTKVMRFTVNPLTKVVTVKLL
ncbi:MAG: minor extracellular serine protease Vpr [Acidobacteriota bacterium]|jgi:subtilisin family serine protease|nr:minor extracellular serine protease Vpr [Acidobacteriota bacterium]